MGFTLALCKYVTVSQLIEELKQVDGDRIIILSKDGEGNGFSPLEALELGDYEPENEWSGEPVEPDESGNSKKAVFVWPRN